jgi:hypothetical protein
VTSVNASTSASVTTRALVGSALLNGTAIAFALTALAALGAAGGSDLFPARSARDVALTIASGFGAGALLGAALQAIHPWGRTRWGRLGRWVLTGLMWGVLVGLGRAAPTVWVSALPWHLFGMTVAYVCFAAFGTWLHGPFDEDDPPSPAA